MNEDLPAVAMPIDPEESRRVRRRRAAKRRIERLVLVWLLAHGVPWLLVFGFGEAFAGLEASHLPAVMCSLSASWLVSLVAAAAAAVVAIRNSSVLQWRWILAALLPWGLFVAEATGLAVSIWL